jgi:hypothetical protein
MADVNNQTDDDNEDSSINHSPSKALKEGTPQPAPTPPVISFAIIESLVYNAVEANRLDIF